MHAWGAAIDLNTKFADYWLWSPKATYRNRFPVEIGNPPKMQYQKMKSSPLTGLSHI
jgi:hypothetical protein